MNVVENVTKTQSREPLQLRDAISFCRTNTKLETENQKRATQLMISETTVVGAMKEDEDKNKGNGKK